MPTTLSIFYPLLIGATLISAMRLAVRINKRTAGINLALLLLVFIFLQEPWNNFISSYAPHSGLELRGIIEGSYWLIGPITYIILHLRLKNSPNWALYTLLALPFPISTLVFSLFPIQSHTSFSVHVSAWILLSLLCLLFSGRIIFEAHKTRLNSQSHPLSNLDKLAIGLFLSVLLFVVIDIAIGTMMIFRISFNPILFDIFYLSRAFMVLIFIAFCQYTHYFERADISEETQQGQQKKSPDTSPRLPESAAKLLMEEVHQSMEERKLYLMPKLTLSALALEVGSTPHDLSEAINHIEEDNFYTLINRYRIEHAKREIERQSNANMLQIAMDSGYGSKGAFYTNFKKYVGLTPQQYRASISAS